MQKIISYLWYDNQAEEAANFYTSIFKNSKIRTITRYDEVSAKASGRPAGSAMTVLFQLEGQEFLALNGGPLFKFSEAVSFLVNCKDQEEVDYYWQKLLEGGEEGQCGWLKDKYGLSWQIIPAILSKMLQEPDPIKLERLMKVFLPMKKIDIKALQQAYQGR